MRLSSARTRGRSLVLAGVLCSAVALAPAEPASASASAAHTPRAARGSLLTSRTFERRVLEMIRSRSATRSHTDERRSAPSVVFAFAELRLRSPDINFPDWLAAAARLGGDTYVVFATQRAQVNGFEQYTWIKEVPDDDVDLGHGPGVFGIHTGTDLGAFGGIDMQFSADHIGAHPVRCHRTGPVVAIDRRAQGSFSGTLTFTPGEGGFPALVRATQPHARVERLVETGARCTKRSLFGCPRDRQFTAETPSGDRLTIDPVYGYASVWTTDEIDGFTIYSSFFSFSIHGSGATDDPVTITRASLTIDGARMGDLFDGTVVFDRSSPPVIRVGRCKTVTTPFLWHSGSLDVDFATGVFSFAGAELTSTLRWMGRAR